MAPRFNFEKPDNLVDLFETAVKRWPNNNLFGVKSGGGRTLEWSTYRQIGDRVDNLRAVSPGSALKRAMRWGSSPTTGPSGQ